MIQQRTTIDDLYRMEGPAELVGGRIIHDMTGERPGEVAENFFVNLRPSVKSLGRGKAHADAEPALPGWRITVDEVLA